MVFFVKLIVGKWCVPVLIPSLSRDVISGVLIWTVKKRLSAKERLVYSVVNPLEVCIHSTLDGYLAIQTSFKLPTSISEEMQLMLQELAKKKVQIAMKNNRKPVGI